MKESEIKYFFIHILLRGKTDYLEYRVPEQDWSNLREHFDDAADGRAKPLSHIRLDAHYRRHVICRVAGILEIKFPWDPIANTIVTDEDEPDDITIHFANRIEPLEIYCCDAYRAFMLGEDFGGMAPKTGNGFAILTDGDGEDHAINLNEVDLIEIPERLIIQACDECEEDMKRSAKKELENDE